jgi:glycosyltransferase involved in cell wall biosynthesis
MSSPHPTTVSFSSNNGLSVRLPDRQSGGSVGRLDGPFKAEAQTSLEFSKKAPIVALCHLSWDWVWQRPQQFLSRLAKTHPVLFVETYCAEVERTTVRLNSAEGHPNVTICQIHLPTSRWSDGKFIDRERRRALQGVMAKELHGQFDDAILWFNDPMAVTAFAGHLDEALIVYDCMDELSQFKGAPTALLEREHELLEVADVVFCGGRKMRDKRVKINPNSYFFGTGVDCRHFGSALSPKLDVAPELASLQGPILGYFGVIDERIDYGLLAALADANPHWHVVMVGPTAKVDPTQFPQRSNLHWIGGRSYAELPALTKGFSVCLMPFALNEATEYINPTKALEYMAAGRPVVSTALDEVKTNFGGVARIAQSHKEFIELCLKEASTPSEGRVARGLRLAMENTWDAIAAKMEALVAEAVSTRWKVDAADAIATAKSQSTLSPLVGNQSAYV